jgi:hypothetical protein
VCWPNGDPAGGREHGSGVSTGAYVGSGRAVGGTVRRVGWIETEWREERCSAGDGVRLFRWGDGIWAVRRGLRGEGGGQMALGRGWRVLLGVGCRHRIRVAV